MKRQLKLGLAAASALALALTGWLVVGDHGHRVR